MTERLDYWVTGIIKLQYIFLASYYSMLLQKGKEKLLILILCWPWRVEGFNSILEMNHNIRSNTENNFRVWLRNRLLSPGLEPVLSQTENMYNIELQKFSTNIKIIIIQLIPGLLALAFGPSYLTKHYSQKAVYNTMR